MSTFPPTSLLPVTQEVATLLKEKKETIAVAETVRTWYVAGSHQTRC